MLPNGKSVLLAFLAGHYAQAAPINTHSKQVRAVIDSVKAQLKADNMADASTAVDEAAAALRADGITNDNIFDRLEHELVALTTEGGFSIDDIAKDTIQYVHAKGAVQKRDQEKTANDTAVPGTVSVVINHVVDHGVKHWKRGDCPDGSQADFCCVIM
ncbi:hypothetical protein LA080_011690 [Diaporthe eres]|uniref:Uncharacterized protein n=1 Tax=Diaporthe vaccinii TaxID=105482 RepID=A0ABR4FCF0_9PEZI|nr:hypothetical protein LA080_011690 [Diaporthe eres]